MAVRTVRKVEVTNLIERPGEYIFKIDAARPSNSFLKASGETKDNLPEFSDSTREILLVLKDVEGSGVFFHSVASQTFLKVKDVSEKDLKAYKKQGLIKESERDGYLLLSTDKGKTYQRIETFESEEREKQDEIFSRLCYACGIPEGTEIDDEDAEGLAKNFKGKTFKGTLAHKEGISNAGEEKTFLKLKTNFKPVSEDELEMLEGLGTGEGDFQ